MKTFTRRDSATALLRKMGIASADYNNFISKKGESVIVDVLAAEASLKPKAVAPKAVAPKAVAPKAVAPKAKVDSKIEANPVDQAPHPEQSVSSYIRTLISEGHTNAEIWTALKKFKNLEDSKSYYPAWNRAQMRKQGLEV